MHPLKIRLGPLITISKTDNPGLDTDALIKRFERPNPAHFKAIRQNRSVYRIPKVIHLAKDAGDRVVMHRGLYADLKRDPGIAGVDDQTLSIPASLPTPKLEGRIYQDRAVEAFQGKRQGVLVAPTGSGKTAMSVRIICALGQATLILVHTADLLAQWQEAFKKFAGLDIGVIQGQNCVMKKVTVGMMQSMEQYTDLAKDFFGAVLIDECHHVPSDTLRNITLRLPARYRYGVTATMNRADELDFLIEACLGPVLHEVRAADLYASGAILRPEVIPVSTDFPELVPDGYADMIQMLTEDSGRNDLILQTIEDEVENGGCALVLSHRVEHARALHALWEGRSGIPAVVATGTSKKADREGALAAIRDGQAHVLFATKIADEGLDLPRLDRLFLTCPSRHHGKVTQQIGRITRPYPGKTDAKVFDFVDWRLKLAASQYRSRRENVYRHI